MTDEHGKPLEYDPQFRGPLEKRSCTDCLCLIIFVAFVGAWAGIGYYAFTQGDISKLLIPTDTEGRRCGMDEGVEDRPYLVFFDLTKCVSLSSATDGCDTPQVCVPNCPTDNFVFTLNYTTDVDMEAFRAAMLCKIEVNLNGTTILDLAQLVLNEKCAAWYLTSTSVTKRCIPTGIPELFVNYTITEEQLASASEYIQLLAEVEQLLKNIYDDFITTRYTMLWFLLGSAIACLIYILLMRWIAAPTTWVSIVAVCVILGYTTYWCYIKYAEAKSTFWLVLMIIFGVSVIIILLIAIFLRKRIYLACQLIREASKAVMSTTSTLIFPIFPWILEIGILLYALITAIYLYTVSVRNYTVELGGDCQCPEDLGYTNGSVCTPSVFDTSCTENNSTCVFGGCYLSSSTSPWFSSYLHAFNIVGLIWLLFFISALGEMILAGTFATWYWTFRKSDVPFFTLTVSIWRTIRYHLGTLAFGSFILTICRIIRIVLEWFDAKMKTYDNEAARFVMKCFKCCFWLLETFLKFLNRNAYIMCAIHGKSFCFSARDAFNLLIRNVVRVFVIDKITDWLLFLGKILVTGLAAWLTWWYFKDSTSINYVLVPMVCVAAGTFLVATVFFGVYVAAVDTLFLCFLEDCERNDGSAEKPYYMHKRLMKILRRS